MDALIVAIIVAAAVLFTLKSFIRVYKGEQRCSCGGCSCASPQSCSQDIKMAAKK
jgi:hypothetical protein